MTEAPDADLLKQFVRDHSEAAFAALVERHIGLVHSVALRHTANPQHAQDITQVVFIILARKAKSLAGGWQRRLVAAVRLRGDGGVAATSLAGWLHQTARLVAANFQRAEFRRIRREQEVFMQSTLNESAPDPLWTELSPLLDDAMSRLRAGDRDALVLRYFQNKSLAEVGAAMGLAERAAQKRVLRAVEKLRAFFAKRGVTNTADEIAKSISANSVQAVSPVLVKAVAATAFAKGATASASILTLTKGALKIMAWTKAKTSVVAMALIVGAAGVGTGIYESHKVRVTPEAALQAALQIQKPALGVWGYPSDKVALAMLSFGSNRASAFPILENTIKSSNPEARKQAVSALYFAGAPPRPEYAKHGWVGEPSPKVVPLLWQILNSDDGELSSLALNSLRGIGFRPEDIPVLVALLVRSHGSQLTPQMSANSSIARMQHFIDRANNDQLLHRYIPESIAETIQKNPVAAAAFISSVNDLLGDTNAEVRFGAACALAKYTGVDDPKISEELKAGLKIKYDPSAPIRTPRFNPEDGLKQLMAVEVLQRVGPDAKSMVPALLEYAHSTQDKVLREHALAAIGYIDPNLRKTRPEVDQAVKNDQTFISMARANSQ